MVDPKKVWKKVFGRYPVGTIVVPNKTFRKLYSVCYIYMKTTPTTLEIPTDKFVGRIVDYQSSRSKKLYYIRWIADRRLDKYNSFLWTEDLFEEL